MTEFLMALFEDSVREFLAAEHENILMGTSERNLCARLACIIEKNAHNNGLEEYFADVEYNRKQGGKVKTIIGDKHQIVTITSDLILHSLKPKSFRRNDTYQGTLAVNLNNADASQL